MSEPPQPRTKRGAFGARRPKGGTHAKAPLPSLVAFLFPFLSFFSSSWSILRSGPHRKRTGSAAIGGRRPYPSPRHRSTGLAKSTRPPSLLRRLKRRAQERGGGTQGASLRLGASPRAPALSAIGAGRVGSRRAERAWSRALERAARHVRALSPSPCFLSLAPARCHPSEFD